MLRFVGKIGFFYYNTITEEATRGTGVALRTEQDLNGVLQSIKQSSNGEGVTE